VGSALWTRGHAVRSERCGPSTARRCAAQNSLHWVRDGTGGEDHSSVRTGNGPQVMAALRTTGINIIRLRGGTDIAAAHRESSYQSAHVLDAVTAAWVRLTR
jgi:hypothetical protein